jgi:intracellular multiplication protein IcmL
LVLNMDSMIYRDRYRQCLTWLIRMSIVAFVLCFILFWQTLGQKQPAYFAAMTNGNIVPIHSLSEPVVTDAFILNWASLTSRSLFNLSFAEYQTQLDLLKVRFTDSGWQRMQTALTSSGIIKTMEDDKLIISAVVSGAPVITSRMVINGRKTWQVQLPLLLALKSASSEVKESLIVTMTIQRIPTLDSAQGIQITDFITSPVS